MKTLPEIKQNIDPITQPNLNRNYKTQKRQLHQDKVIATSAILTLSCAT